MKRFFQLLWCCLLVSPIALCQSPEIVRGPYLQKAFTTQPGAFSTSSITIRWRTNVPTVGRVVYSENSDFTQLGPNSPFVDETTRSTEHSATLSDLIPNKQYRYYIGTGNDAVNPANSRLVLEKSADHFFKTPPLRDRKKLTKMWVLGDFGAFPPSDFINRQDSTIAAFKDFMIKNNTGPMDLWLWLGDNAYDGGKNVDYDSTVFNKKRSRYDWMFRQTPFYPIPGNHEYQFIGQREQHRLPPHDIDYFKIVSTFENGEAGGEPSGKKEYYSFDYSNIHIIGLDSYGYEKAGDTYNNILSPSSVQYQWLERDLIKAQANSNINWIIVMLHHPPYTGGTHNSDLTTQPDVELGALRRNLIPLLDKYKVDLVLSGHSHGYERSRLMKGHTGFSNTFDKAQHTPAVSSYAQGSGRYDGTANSCFYHKKSAAKENEGIVYVVNGAGGRSQTAISNRPLVDSLMQSAKTTATGGSMYLEVDNKKLSAKFIAINNQVLDQFTIYKDTESFTIPQTDGITRTAVCECTDLITDDNRGDFKYFTHYIDGKGNLLLSINKLGHDIGKTGVPPFEVKLGGAKGRQNVGAYYADNLNYVRSDQIRLFSSGWRVMNRYWTVKPQTELSGNEQVIVRHYYKLYDWDDLGRMRHDEFMFYKINSLTKEYTIDPQTDIHNKLPGAESLNKDGIWLYENGFHTSIATYNQASIATFKWTNGLSKIFANTHLYKNLYKNYPYGYPYTRDSTIDNVANFSGEFVVGRLNGGGGIGGQTYSINPRGTNIALRAGSEWYFYAKGQAPPDIAGFNWKGGQDGFNSDHLYESYDTRARWNRGPAPLGYSPIDLEGARRDGEKTLIPACQNQLNCYEDRGEYSNIREGCAPCTSKWITTYYRSYINADNFSYFKSIIINYKRDDGIVIYFNGKEAHRENLPSGAITYNTLASNASNENEWITKVIPNNGTYIREGTNTIAVEIHQVSEVSSDARFDMEIIFSPDVIPATTRLAALEEAVPTESITVLYPNPTENGKVYFTEAIPYETVRVVDTRGVVVRYISEPGILNELDLSALSTGIYILSSQNKNKTSHFKIVKK